MHTLTRYPSRWIIVLIDCKTLIHNIECLQNPTRRNHSQGVFTLIPRRARPTYQKRIGDRMPDRYTNRDYPRCKCGKVFSDVLSLADHTLFCPVYRGEHPTPKPAPKPKPTPPVVVPEFKTCYTCGETKPTSEFTRRPGNVDGFCGVCRTCLAAYQRQYRETKEGTIKENWD